MNAKKWADQRIAERIQNAVTREWIRTTARKAAALTIATMADRGLELPPSRLVVFRDPRFAAFRRILRSDPTGLGPGALAARELFHETYCSEVERLQEGAL